MNIKSTLVLLALVPVMAYAQFFPAWYPSDGFDVGEIESIKGSSTLSFDDRQFLLSPTVKVSSMIQKKAKFSLIKPGVTVGLKMIKFNNKTLVDHIYILPDEPK